MCYGLLCGSVYVTRGGGFQRRKPLKLRVCKGKKNCGVVGLLIPAAILPKSYS